MDPGDLPRPQDSQWRAGGHPATRACELTEWKVAHGLTTLAAAYSEAGNFAAAVEWQAKAIALVADKSPEQHEYRRLLDPVQGREALPSPRRAGGDGNPADASKRNGSPIGQE